KAQVNPRVPDRSRAPHRILQRTSCGLVVARSDCVLSEGNEKPARSVPPALRLRQQSDCFHKELVGLVEFSFRHSLRACLCHPLHVAEDRVGKLVHLLTFFSRPTSTPLLLSPPHS